MVKYIFIWRRADDEEEDFFLPGRFYCVRGSADMIMEGERNGDKGSTL